MFRQRSTHKALDAVGQKTTEHRKLFWDTDPAIGNGKYCQNDQGSRHRPGCFLGMFCFRCARFAEKGQRDLTHCVESSQECRDSKSDEDHDMTVRKCICKDLVLGPEACGNQRETRE